MNDQFVFGKNQPVVRRTVAVWCIIMLCTVLAACGGSDAAGEEMEMDHSEMADGEMADGEMADDGAMSETVQISLQPAPEGAAGEYLAVALTDAAGEPITDASVGLEGNMNHGGMVPVMADAVTDDADGAADGIYQVPFTFNMNGDWIVTVMAELVDGTMETQDVNLTVTEESVDIAE